MLGLSCQMRAQRIVHAIRKPRNNAYEAIAPKPGGTGLSGRSAVSRRSPMGACHWLRVASCISSRKAAVAATRDLFRGSLALMPPQASIDHLLAELREGMAADWLRLEERIERLKRPGVSAGEGERGARAGAGSRHRARGRGAAGP